MKTGFTNGKLNKIRRFLTPVLIIALVICGLWLPEVKVKAWSAGEPVTIRIHFDLDGGGQDGVNLGYDEPVIVQSSGYDSTEKMYSFDSFTLATKPAIDGKLANQFAFVPEDPFNGYYGMNSSTPSSITIGQSYTFSEINYYYFEHFATDGVADIYVKAVYSDTPTVIRYKLYQEDQERTTFPLYSVVENIQGSFDPYYFQITIPEGAAPLNNGHKVFRGKYYSGKVFYHPLDNGEDGYYLEEGRPYLVENRYNFDISDVLVFEPQYVYVLPVKFVAGNNDTITGTNSNYLIQEIELSETAENGYLGVIPTLPTVEVDQESGHTFDGHWIKDDNMDSAVFVGKYNDYLTQAPEKIPVDSGLGILIDDDDLLESDHDFNLVFNASYRENLTLTVNFAVPQNYGGTFPDGSKYLSPLTLTIPEPDTLPDYYAFTIPGEDIDEVSIVYEETGSSDGPYPHYLKAFVDNNNVLEDGTANVALGENATILVDSTIFNDNSASITLTGVFSEQAGLNLFRQGSGDRDFAKLIRFEDNYAVCKGQLDPSTIGSGDALPAGLISFAECFTYAGSEQLLIEDSNGNAVTKMGYGTDYYFYILKSVVDASSNSSVDIPLAPVGKMEFDAIFDAGVGGTITGEGTATTKQVTVSTEIMDGNNNWLAESVSVPEVTPKTGYVFKRWVQQQLTEITMPANEKDIDPQYITGSSANFEIGNTYARSSAGSALRSSGLTYTAEYYQCSLIATFNPGDHAQSGIQSSSTTINAKSYDAATGKFTFEVTFPSYTPVSGYVHDGFEVMTNNYAVSLAQGSYYPAGQTVEIEASAGNATQIELTFTAHYDAMPMLTVNFYTGNTPVGSVSQYPMSNTADSNGLYSYSIDVPDITTYHENFGAAFPIYKILAPENSGISFEVYRGSKNLTEYEVTDNETVVVKVSAATTLRWEAIDAIKTTGDYQVYDGGNCLTRGRWTIGVTGGESDGYEYNVTVPVSFYPGNNVDLTVTKLP